MAALKQGSKGSDVTKLQNQLKGLGYYTGSIDGSFGPQTLAAVKAYQKSQGLAVDGSVGPLTQAALGWTGSSTKPVAGTTKVQAPQVPKIEAFKPDTSNQPKPPVVEAFKPDESNKPTIPEIAPPPKIDPFNPTIDKAQLQQDALELLLPQYERGQEQLSDLYAQNQQRISDDALKRGLARGSYVGNRLDTEGSEHGKRLGDLDRSYNEQANLMAAQNYETEWGKQYQLHRDTVGDIWRAYGADVDNAWRSYDAAANLYGMDLDNQRFAYTANTQNAWQNFEALMGLYNIDLDNQRLNYQTGVENAWQQYGADYSQYRDSVADTQWQSQFDLSKSQFDWQKQMDKENLALAKSRASSGGSSKSSSKSSSSKVDPFALAMNDLTSSADPYTTFRSKRGQYAAVLSTAQMQQLEAYANAHKPKSTTPKQSTKSQTNIINRGGGLQTVRGLIV